MMAVQPVGHDPDPDAEALVAAVAEMAEVFGVARDLMLREMAEQIRRIAAVEELRRLHDVRRN
jgi:hypothetical protein